MSITESKIDYQHHEIKDGLYKVKDVKKEVNYIPSRI